MLMFFLRLGKKCENDHFTSARSRATGIGIGHIPDLASVTVINLTFRGWNITLKLGHDDIQVLDGFIINSGILTSFFPYGFLFYTIGHVYILMAIIKHEMVKREIIEPHSCLRDAGEVCL